MYILKEFGVCIKMVDKMLQNRLQKVKSFCVVVFKVYRSLYNYRECHRLW